VAAVAAVLALPWLIPFIIGLLSFAGQRLIEIAGLGLLPLTILISAGAWQALGRPLPTSTSGWRVIAGVALLVVAANGFMSWFRPDWEVGEVPLNEVTAGGHLGHLFTSSTFGYLLLIVSVFSGVAMVWPRGLALAGSGTLWLGGQIWALRLPQRLWSLLGRTFSLFMPKGYEQQEGNQLVDVISSNGDDGMDLALLDDDEFQVIESRLADDDDEEEPQKRLAKQETRSLGPGQPADQGFAAVYPLSTAWDLPPIDILKASVENGSRNVDNSVRAQLIIDTLSSFGVDAKVVQINQGPTVTQFGIEPGWEIKTRTVMERDSSGRIVYDKDGNPKYKSEVVSRTRVRVNQITALANDLALALAAPSIRIEAPVPGKPIIGIEVPNSSPSVVSLRSVIESAPFQKLLSRTKLALTLGKGVSGDSVAADLSKMPHLLIAGATGSGKSVCINSIIASLLMHSTADDVRFVMVDPKRVELVAFANIPHLAFSSIITDPEDVVGALQAVLHEMESRYRRFAQLGVRNIEGYNRSPKVGRKLPYWVVIIDELADLMMAAPYQVEKQLCRLAQLARATGIHLVVATQRPSVDVITGLIKANFPTRIAFAVTSQVDSRTIIDGGGAEKLLGRGDMLFMPTDAAKPRRLQGAYISDEEIDKLVDFWMSDRFANLRPEPVDNLLEEAKVATQEEGEDDRLMKQARALALEHTRISTSLLQRRLRIGYPRAARLMEQLEKEEIVSPAEGGQSRRVLSGTQEDEID
jgi:S-DNA-T family DNA segregation ATPase FtsK/SpoIIIE